MRMPPRTGRNGPLMYFSGAPCSSTAVTSSRGMCTTATLAKWENRLKQLGGHGRGSGRRPIEIETEELAHHWGGCSEPFHPIAEEVEEPFGTARRQWTYSAADDLLGRDVGSLPGKFGTYPAGGYVAIPRPASTQEPAQSTCCRARVSPHLCSDR